MKLRFRILNEHDRGRAVNIINGLPLDPVHEFSVEVYKKNRSAQQNAYYWQVITIVGNDLGMTKDEMHEVYKEQFLIPIFTRDDPGFAEMMQALRLEKHLIKQVVNLVSTTQCNTKQMSEYIDDIQSHAAGLGIRLPAPEWME